MKCKKCHVTMYKYTSLRIATCPQCGREVSYRTKADKKGSGYLSGYQPTSSGGILSGLLSLAFSAIFSPGDDDDDPLFDDDDDDDDPLFDDDDDDDDPYFE